MTIFKRIIIIIGEGEIRENIARMNESKRNHLVEIGTNNIERHIAYTVFQ